jgi:succinate dehydrogenase/fumarate reductase-like Fe-S protein
MRFPWSRPAPDLEIRLEKLERVVRDLVLDWDQTYEKFRLLSLRLSKRAKRAEEQEQGELEPETVEPYERG